MNDIVLMHGWGCDRTIWAGLQTYLENTYGSRFRVAAPDFPGFGTEPEPTEPWGMEQYTAWFEGWLAERGIVNPILVCHSFGGRVGLIFASRNRVHKIILVDAAGVRRKSLKRWVKVLSFKFLKRVAPKELVERWRARTASPDYNAASPVMRGTLTKVVRQDLRRFMPLIEAPTLLIWGSEDTATPLRDARTMKRLIPGAGLVVFEGAGHYSFLDRPFQFYAVMDSFLNSK